ncbi:beta strand repeat-containing protein [bacterium]
MKKYLFNILFFFFIYPSIAFAGFGAIEISSVTAPGNLLYFDTQSSKDFKVGNDYIFIDGASGNVGISISTPSFKLDVSGSINFSSGELYFPDATSMNSSGTLTIVSISSNTHAQIIADSNANNSGDVELQINGITEMIAANSGNVGIDVAVPGEVLAINGNITALSSIFSGPLSGTTIDTGYGAYELYAMNQHVQSTDTVTFSGTTISNNLSADTLSDGTFSITNGILSAGNSVQAGIGNFDKVYVSSITGKPDIYIKSNVDMTNNDLPVSEISVSTISTAGSNGLYLVDDADNGIFIQDGGNIGIDINNPNFKLDVSTCIRISQGQLSFPDGSSMSSAGAGSAEAISNNVDAVISADADTNGSGEIQFNTNGSEKMVILNNGNVGIGSAAPAYLLDINNSIRFNTGMFYFPDGSTLGSAQLGSLQNLSYTDDISVTADADGNSTGEIVFTLGITEKMVILNNGNVGIGDANPSELLVVNGNINSTDCIFSGPVTGPTLDTGQGAYELLVMNQDVQTTSNVTFATTTLTNTLTSSSLTDGTLSISNGILSSGNSVQAGIGNFDKVFVSSITGKTQLYLNSNLDINNNEITVNEIITSTINASNSNGLFLNDYNGIFIQDTGNLGIGKISAAYKLDVSSSIRFSSGGLYFADGSTMTTAGVTGINSLSNSVDVNISADSDTNGTGEIQFITNGTEKIVILNNGNTGISNSSEPGVLFQVADDTLTVSSNGNVGISSSSPDSRLKINGSIAMKSTDITSTYTADQQTYINCNISGNMSLNLPPAGDCSGRMYFIRYNYVSGGNPGVTIDPNGSETINGNSTLIIKKNSSIKTYIAISNGTGWYTY